MTRSNPEVALATIDLSYHHAAAGVVRAVFERYGIAVRELRRPHKAAFDLLKSGAVDMLCTAWLPGSHGTYFDEFENDFEKLVVIYKPYALWGVLVYVGGLKSEVQHLSRIRCRNARKNFVPATPT